MNGMVMHVNYSILFLYTCGLAYYSPRVFFKKEPLIGRLGGGGEQGTLQLNVELFVTHTHTHTSDKVLNVARRLVLTSGILLPQSK